MGPGKLCGRLVREEYVDKRFITWVPLVGLFLYEVLGSVTYREITHRATFLQFGLDVMP